VLARAVLPGPALPRAVATRTRGQPSSQRRRAPAGGDTVKVFQRASLAPGTMLHGPCSIEEMTGAIWLPSGATARAGPSGIGIVAAKGGPTD
jgi:N-methylhydantoinase A/oxoprolinase/acetone carboxylase beta subunit